MIFWLDAQLPPALAKFLTEKFGVQAHPVREIGLRDGEDREIFEAARKKAAVLISKDSDFIDLVERLGPPPQLLWVTCGNVSNERLCNLFSNVWPEITALLEAGEAVIEIGDKPDRD